MVRVRLESLGSQSCCRSCRLLKFRVSTGFWWTTWRNLPFVMVHASADELMPVLLILKELEANFRWNKRSCNYMVLRLAVFDDTLVAKDLMNTACGLNFYSKLILKYISPYYWKGISQKHSVCHDRFKFNDAWRQGTRAHNVIRCFLTLFAYDLHIAWVVLSLLMHWKEVIAFRTVSEWKEWRRQRVGK